LASVSLWIGRTGNGKGDIWSLRLRLRSGLRQNGGRFAAVLGRRVETRLYPRGKGRGKGKGNDKDDCDRKGKYGGPSAAPLTMRP
jgi:hypothetical protein